ncbi:MAG: P-loop NTPase [Beijerinckiaceae bacterium]
MAAEKAILEALKAVAGPDGKTPLPESGAISGMTQRDDKVFMAILVDPDRAHTMEPMRKAAEDAIKAVPGVADARVILTADTPERPGAQQQPVGRAARPKPAQDAPPSPHGVEPVEGIRHIIAVASGKGGVGKSTTAANLALALAAEGWRVGLLDADVYGPSAPRLFGLSGRPDMDDDGLYPMLAYGIKIMSIGLLIEEDAPVVWRGPMVMSAVTQLLRDVQWGDLDCLVVDMPPGTGDVQLTMAQTVPLAGAVIVSTPQDLALIDARRGIGMFNQVKVPVLGIVENMSYFLCPHCGGRTDIFAHGGARHEAETRDVAFLGEVPLDATIRETSDAGKPIVGTQPDSPHSHAYRAIARAVKEKLEAPAPRAAPRIVKG